MEYVYTTTEARFSRLSYLGNVGYEQRAVDDVDISLDTCEAVLERIDEGAGVLVIVVRVGTAQHGLRRGGVHQPSEDQDDQEGQTNEVRREI
jgi:hypothetical protein